MPALLSRRGTKDRLESAAGCVSCSQMGSVRGQSRGGCEQAVRKKARATNKGGAGEDL